MTVDPITLDDLSVFSSQENNSLFNRLDLTETRQGKDFLRHLFERPLGSKAEILAVQESLQFILKYNDRWPAVITNGTLMVTERYFDTVTADIPDRPSPISARMYLLLHGPDFSLIRYSMKHVTDLFTGLIALCELIDHNDAPSFLRRKAEKIRSLLKKAGIESSANIPAKSKPVAHKMLQLAKFIRFRFKRETQELIDGYAEMDAYRSMALAGKQLNLQLPVFTETREPIFKAEGLKHLLVEHAVSYNTELSKKKNFLFLTGANMAGKSTFIKACGDAVYLAHLGMGVPAASLQLSVFDGVLSNINITDNVSRGESYFYNEVQRIKNTVTKISDGKTWFVLIDELFKGTNIQDAMRCSKAVIEGLVHMPNALFILSTHLYEIGHELTAPNIQFNYFETKIANGKFSFSYQLKDGISEDRLGYMILEREGVTKMLDALK